MSKALSIIIEYLIVFIILFFRENNKVKKRVAGGI